MNLYGPQVKQIARVIEALDAAAKDAPDDDFTPYAQFVPILVDGELEGFVTDEIGGAYSYERATQAQLEWWSRKPKP